MSLERRAPGWLLLGACAVMVGPHVWPLDAVSWFGYDPGDKFIFFWNFWWTRVALSSLQSPYWTDRLMYPSGAALSLHSHPMTYGLISLPFQLLIPGPHGLALAFNMIVVLSFLLSSYGAYRLALHVTGSPAGAVIAGFLFAYTPFRFLNMSRLHLLATECLAFYVLAFVCFVERPGARRALAVGLLLALTYYTSLEYALYLVFFSVLWLVLQARALRQAPKAIARGLVQAALVFLAVSSPLLWLQARDMSSARLQPVRDLGEAQYWSPALVSLVIPSRLHPLYGDSLAFLGEYRDGAPALATVRSEASLGICALALAAIGVLRCRRDRSGPWLVAFLSFAILALGPTLRITRTWETEWPLPYRALYALVPPLRAARDPTRLLPVASLFLAVLAAFGVRLLMERLREARTATLLAIALGGLVLFEDRTRAPYLFEADRVVQPMYRWLAHQHEACALIDLSREALIAQTVHGHPLVSDNGAVLRASRTGPAIEVESHFRDPTPIFAKGSAALAEQLRADRDVLQRLHICYVVLPGYATDAQRQFAELMGRSLGPSNGSGFFRIPQPGEPMSRTIVGP